MARETFHGVSMGTLGEHDLRKLRVLGWSYYKVIKFGGGCRVSVRTGKTAFTVSGTSSTDCLNSIPGIEEIAKGVTSWKSTDNWKVMQMAY